MPGLNAARGGLLQPPIYLHFPTPCVMLGGEGPCIDIRAAPRAGSAGRPGDASPPRSAARRCIFSLTTLFKRCHQSRGSRFRRGRGRRRSGAAAGAGAEPPPGPSRPRRRSGPVPVRGAGRGGGRRARDAPLRAQLLGGGGGGGASFCSPAAPPGPASSVPALPGALLLLPLLLPPGSAAGSAGPRLCGAGARGSGLARSRSRGECPPCPPGVRSGARSRWIG